MGAVQVLLESNPTLRERVHLLGALPHEHMELACRASDFLMSGSHREGSGYAVIEALACGTTPILSDIPAFRALTGRGLVGALAPPGAHPVFAEQLLRLARADRAMLRARAREHFERSLTFPVLGARLLGAYRELLADRQRSGKRSAAS
jgi:glycosyltransferase involved in cell wall biosynthesis